MRINRLLIGLAAIVCATIGAAMPAWAQYQSGSSSGMFGSRSVGSGTLSGGQRSFSGASASGGLGASGAGLQNQQSVGVVSGNERFNRDARAANAFVGADSGDSTNPFSQMQGGRLGGLGQLGGLNGLNRNAFNQNGLNGLQQFGQPGGRTNQRNVPTVMRVGFVPPSPPAALLNSRLTQRLAKASTLQKVGTLEVALSGRTAVLRGQVQTEHDRVLAEQLILLEPGVSDVVNELTLASSPETVLPGTLPAAGTPVPHAPVPAADSPPAVLPLPMGR